MVQVSQSRGSAVAALGLRAGTHEFIQFRFLVGGAWCGITTHVLAETVAHGFTGREEFRRNLEPFLIKHCLAR